MADNPSVPPGSLLGGKFRIERLLGAGAMGTVYAIDHELTRHKRALKLLHPAVQNIPDIVRRFLNEASAAGRAGNPHLVETFDAGTLPSGEPYVVMELLEGETLGAVLRRERVLTPSLAAELVAQAAEGMEAAHNAGIIHRDLKPENLFVTARDGGPFIKIMDFGVSKFATGTSSTMRGTQAGMVYGSPAYMSPEQLTAQVDVDRRTDVFALGVVLFECLTGALPFDGPTVEVLMVKVLSGDMPPIESLRPGLAPSLMDVVRRSLAPNRDERFPGAGAMAEALLPFRALPPRQQAEIGFAATIASTPPLHPSSHPPSAYPALALRGPRSRSGPLPILGALAILLAAGAALAFALTREPSVQAVPALASAQSAPALASAQSASPSIAPSAPGAAPATTVSSLAPLVETASPGRPVEPRRAAPPAPITAAAAPAASRSSPAQDLGLRVDNPFR